MTTDEFKEISYLIRNGWPGQFDEDNMAAYAEFLMDYDYDAVRTALHELSREGLRFVPSVGLIVEKLEPQLPSFDVAWSLMASALSSATQHPEAVTVAKIAEVAGPVVAGWVAGYGARRLATEPVFDPDFGGAVFKRVAASYQETAGSSSGRRLALERAQRVVAELEQGERLTLPVGDVEIGD